MVIFSTTDHNGITKHFSMSQDDFAGDTEPCFALQEGYSSVMETGVRICV